VARRSPTVRERRLARVLRHLREEADLTIEEVAEKLEMSASTVSRIETAQVGVRPRDLGFLLELYEVSETDRDQLLQIARERRQQHWWQEYADLPTVVVAGFEAEASTISQYSTQLVPGLLQTEAYARAVLEAIRLDAKPVDIERRLQLRIHRQALLTSEHPPEYWVVLDEAALRREVGGPAVMAEQLGRLIEVAKLPNVTLQVLPLEAGAHPAMVGAFSILRFTDQELPDVVYLEHLTSALYLSKQEDVDQYAHVMEGICLRSAAPDKASEIVGKILSEA